MSTDYYLVPGSARMHILTNGKASFGDASFNINGNYTLAAAGPVNVQGIYSSKNALDPSNNTYSVGTVIRMPADTSANRPTASYAGYIRYNTGVSPDFTPDTIEYYNLAQGLYLPIYAPPIIYSVSPNKIGTVATGGITTTYTITGEGFGVNITVYFIGNDGVTTFASPSVSSTGGKTITAAAPQFFSSNNSQAIALESWSVRVLNNISGLANTSFYCIYGDLSWNSPAPFSTIPMLTSYYYSTASPAPATTFTILPPSGVTVNFKFDLTVNSTKISQYKLAIYNNGSNNGCLVTTSNTNNPATISPTPGDIPVPNGSTTVTDQFQIAVISYNTSGGATLLRQVFNVSISPAWIPALNVTAGSYTITTYPPGGGSPFYRVYTFSPGTNTFTIPSVADPSLSQVDMLIVGGGGGGGGGYQSGGGGGGAVISTTSSLGYCGGPTYYGLNRNPTDLGPYTINTGTNTIPLTSTIYTAFVGSGGAGAYYNYYAPYSTAPTNGGTSYFKAASTTLFQAIGGGAGAYELNISSNSPNSIHGPGNPGGSGGGNSHWGPQVSNTYDPSYGSISNNYAGSAPYPFFTVVPNVTADVSYNNNPVTNNNINIVTINGSPVSGYNIPDPSNNNGRFGYMGGSGISSNSYFNVPYPNIFVGGGGGGAGDGIYGNTGDPSGNARQYFQQGQINAFNNYNRSDPSGIAYIPPALTNNYSNQFGIAGYGGNGITNTITGTSITLSPGGGGGVRVGNNQQPPTNYPGIVASLGGSGQSGYGQGFTFFQNTTPGSTYSNATSNGNPGVYGAGGGGGGAPDENNSYSGMTAGSGSAGTVIIRYRIG